MRVRGGGARGCEGVRYEVREGAIGVRRRVSGE